MSKDFIRNNIKYITKLSSKIRRDKSEKGLKTFRREEGGKLVKNQSINDI